MRGTRRLTPSAGNQCRSYGAAAIMRVPGRVHISWPDDNTLRLETDAGTQMRTFRFEASGGQSIDARRTASRAGRAIRSRSGKRPAPDAAGAVRVPMRPGRGRSRS